MISKGWSTFVRRGISFPCWSIQVKEIDRDKLVFNAEEAKEGNGSNVDYNSQDVQWHSMRRTNELSTIRFDVREEKDSTTMEDEDALRPPTEFLCREAIRCSNFRRTWRHSRCWSWIVVQRSNESSRRYSKEKKRRWFVSTLAKTNLLDRTDFDLLRLFDAPISIPNQFHNPEETVVKQSNRPARLSFDHEEVHWQPRTTTHLSEFILEGERRSHRENVRWTLKELLDGTLNFFARNSLSERIQRRSQTKTSFRSDGLFQWKRRNFSLRRRNSYENRSSQLIGRLSEFE